MMGETASARKAAASKSKSETVSTGKAAASKSKSKSESTKGSAVGTGRTHRPAVWTVGINHQEEITYHHSIHVLNDFGGSVSEEGLPEGYLARHLQLSKEDGKERNRAMMNDETGIHGVRVRQIHGCIMGAETNQELWNKIEPWIGRSFFKIRHPSTENDMVYVPITQTRVRFDREDATRILVPYVPRGAKIQLVEHEHIQEYDETQEEWMREQHEMQSQMIMMCHDNEGHPKEGQTRVNIRSAAYWPEIKTDIKPHYESCHSAYQKGTFAKKWVMAYYH